MQLSSDCVLQAQRITQRIAVELTPANCDALRLSARTLGREAWIRQMKRVRDESAYLLTVEPHLWKNHPVWRQETSRYLHLCCMLICALQGATLLELLSSRAHFLAGGKRHRITLAFAFEFVRDLDDFLPDPWWPLDGNPFLDS